jgi:hypothetical protein
MRRGHFFFVHFTQTFIHFVLAYFVFFFFPRIWVGLERLILQLQRLKFLSSPMKGSAKRKCLCCGEFYPPDHRNLRHQRYCSKPAYRKESKAQSQWRWLQSPENQNYFRGPENR